MSKKKEILVKQSIIEKAKELGFRIEEPTEIYYKYPLPFGHITTLYLDKQEFDLIIERSTIEKWYVIPIRKIESPEDLENLFNAICPEKYRLPFD